MLPGRGLVLRAESGGVYGVGDGGDFLSLQEGGAGGLLAEPVAAGDEAQGCAAVERGLAAEDAAGQVDGQAVLPEEGTGAALCVEGGALAGVMAEGSGGPHVVHCPNHGLPRAEDALQVAQRQVALVYPVQVDHVGLAELGPAGHVGSGVGYVHGEEIAAAEPVGAPDDEALP